ncbi:hypothetical protein EDD18DRAFT_1113393 [Armillaria luteobubalina]|uniref:Uncharacterized protein n=1 Tax=Armillaria luteobubalina TaxID=153913 RepID=A0AA39PBR1_9AGAR|nr:hypothetical protein EDD18DRAFT_1113393 [Armillaria luteobubalina]
MTSVAVLVFHFGRSYCSRRVGELFLVTGYGGSSSENIPVNLVKFSLSFLSLRPSSTASVVLSAVGVPTLAKIKPQHILEHLRMASSEQPAVPPQTDDTSSSTSISGPSKPTAFQQSLARGKFYAGLDSLSSLQEAPPQPHWTSARVDKWVREAKKLWAHCSAQVEIAKISAKEFRGVEFEFLQLLVDFPDERIEGATVEYNDLIARARQYKIRVFPLPIPETPVVETTPTPQAPLHSTAVPPSPTAASAVSVRPKAASIDTTVTPSAGVTPTPTAIPPKVPLTDRSASSQAPVPQKAPSDASAAGPPRPKLTLHGPRPAVTTQDLLFRLDPTSPLHSTASIAGAISTSNPLMGARRPQGATLINPTVPPARTISPPPPRTHALILSGHR